MPSEDVILHIGRVGDLLRQIQDAVDNATEPALAGPVRRYRGSWAEPIFPTGQTYNSALIGVLPDGAALEALALVSAQLHAIAPDGVVPDANQLEELRVKLRELVDAVREADDVPPDLKMSLVARLRDVEEAIEHLDIGGPAAVQRAMEAVMGGALFQNPRAAKSHTIHKVWTTLLLSWTVFSSGPAIQNSLEAWRDIVPALQSQDVAPSGDEGPEAPSDGEHPAKHS